MARKLVVFEGIDNSGKTTVSRLVRNLLEKETAVSWEWNKEPRFSTEEADRLNSEEMKDEYVREAMFFQSRFAGQELYRWDNTVLDRYTWTGVAYASVFSPSVAPFVRQIYLEPRSNPTPVFKIPDVFVFMDTDPQVCLEREPSVGLDRLLKLRKAYLDLLPYLNAPVILSSANGDKTPEQIAEELVPEIMKKL